MADVKLTHNETLALWMEAITDRLSHPDVTLDRIDYHRGFSPQRAMFDIKFKDLDKMRNSPLTKYGAVARVTDFAPGFKMETRCCFLLERTLNEAVDKIITMHAGFMDKPILFQEYTKVDDLQVLRLKSHPSFTEYMAKWNATFLSVTEVPGWAAGTLVLKCKDGGRVRVEVGNA